MSLLKSIGDPVKKRYAYYSTIDDCYRRFEELSTHCNNKLAEIAHLTDA
jgi:hypothetical protein